MSGSRLLSALARYWQVKVDSLDLAVELSRTDLQRLSLRKNSGKTTTEICVVRRFAYSNHKTRSSTWLCTEKSDFSVQPLCPLCLCGCFFEQFLNHRGTEDTEVA